MLWLLVGLVLLMWLGDFAFNVAGGLVHALLVIAVLMVLYNVFVRGGFGRRTSL